MGDVTDFIAWYKGLYFILFYLKKDQLYWGEFNIQ